jgi:hypothetical protein
MGKVPCTDHVHSKSCVIEMHFGHGTIARVASPQRWSESICKGKPGLSGPAGECAAAVEGREGRSRVTGAGLGACRVRVRPGARTRHGHGAVLPPGARPRVPRESARAPWPGLRHRAGRPALMGRAVDAGWGAAVGQLAGRSWGRGAGGGGPVEGEENRAVGGSKTPARAPSGGEETLTGGRRKPKRGRGSPRRARRRMRTRQLVNG